MHLKNKKQEQKNTIMGVTRLKRKDRKNSYRANARVAKIKLLTAKPVIKNIDIEAVKKSFEEKKAAAAAAN